MPTPAIQTLINDAQQVLNLDSISAVRSVVAVSLANANTGTPLNPNLTTQQLWNEFYQVVTRSKSDIESIIANQLMKFLYAPPAPGGVGANKQVIFNDNGILAGDAGLTYDKATDSLTISGDLTVDTSTLKVTASTDTVTVGATTTDAKFRVVDANYNGLRIGFFPGTLNYNLYDATVHEFRTASVTPQQLYTLQASSSVWYDGAGGTRMTLNATGLGVGGSPNAKVSCAGFSSANVAPDFQINRSSSGTGIQTGPNLTFSDGTSNNTVALQNSQGRFGIWNYGAGSWNERLSVDSSGNVGIGVTPSAWSNSGNIDLPNVFMGISSSGTYGGAIANNAYYNAGWKYKAANYANLYLTGAGEHKWLNAPVGAAAGDAITFTQAMTLDASGNLLIKKTASGGTTLGVELLATGQINGATANQDNLNIYNTTAAAYRFYVNAAGTVFATNTTISAISDARFKENVQDIDVGLGAILALKPRKFDWKDGKGKNIKGDRGFIAQEFETVFPNLIDEWKENAPEGEAPYKSVRQDLIPVLVKAIQELTARVQTLETR